MVERIGVRELRQNASRYLDRVRAGETVEVTDRGKLVALLTPPTPAQSTRDELIAEGRLIAASGRLVPPSRVRVQETTESVLERLRADT